MRDSVVYQHIRLDSNEIFYIGIGCIKRAYSKHGRNKYWKNTVKKTKYFVKILTDNISWENAQEAEIALINIYGRKDLNKGNLVNMTDGGEGILNRICTIDTRRKISSINAGNKNSIKNHTEESKIKISKKNSKKIIDTKTNIVYENRKIVSEIFNINYNTLAGYLNGNLKNKTTLKWLY